MVKSISLWGSVEDDNMSNIFDDLIKTDWKKIDRLDLYINSYGGELYAGLAFYDYLKSLPIQVRTIGIGKVMSAGTIIFLAGDIRECYTHTYFMVHNMSDSISGPIHHLEAEVKIGSKINEDMVKIYQQNTLIKKKSDWVKKLKSDTYFTANEAVDIGLADGVIK